MPFEARWEDVNLSFGDAPGCYQDYVGSEKHSAIVAIVGAENRKDALHVDSAYKSGCVGFIGCDSDIMDKAAQLQELLGMRFLRPTDPEFRSSLMALVSDGGDSGAAGR